MARYGILKPVGLVIGAISLIAGDAQAQTEYEVLMSSSSAQVRSFLGAEAAKLVYVNLYAGAKQLHYLDFSQGDGEPVIHRIAAVIDPTAPMISPDGEWVVYARCLSGGSCNAQSGEHLTDVSIRSSVYICRLQEDAQPVLLVPDSAYEPRFLWEGNPNRLTIVYPTLAQVASWNGPGRTMLLDIDTAGDVPVAGTPQVLFADGGYAGGLSIDRRYLCSGGNQAVMIDMQSGATRPDTLTHEWTLQVCNPSITSSRVTPDRMMYLDFMGTGAIPLDVNGGQAWEQWQMIWVVNSSGQWVRWYKYPTSPEFPYSYLDSSSGHVKSPGYGWETYRFASWHHQEWSNHPYFAASAVYVDRGYKLDTWPAGVPWYHTVHQERITLIDLRSGLYQEVARRKNLNFVPATDSGRANGLYYPTLWVRIPQGFVEEPLSVRRHGAVIAPGAARVAGGGVFDILGRRLTGGSASAPGVRLVGSAVRGTRRGVSLGTTHR